MVGIGRMAHIAEQRIFGYRLHPLTKAQLLDLVVPLERVAHDGGHHPTNQIVIASANLHGLLMHERHADYRALHRRPGTLIIVDGMPVIWLLRALGRDVGPDHRTTWLDWFEDALTRAAATGRRVFVLGHTPDVLRTGLCKAAQRWPDLVIDGADGYFELDDRSTCLDRIRLINKFAPDILFVGMGMPRQERFAAEYSAQITAPVIGLGGAAFAYFAGDQASAPRWMGRVGLEWLHRLGSDPRRLAGRYLCEPFLLAYAVGRRTLSEPDGTWDQSDEGESRRS